jgi:two-component system response regulator DesR
MLRILLAESQSSLRSAMKLNLEQDSRTAFIAEAVDAQSLMRYLSRSEVDIILLEWELPGLLSTDISRIHQLAPAVKVLVLGRNNLDKDSAFNAGADGFILKGSPPEQFIQNVKSI